MQIICEPFPLAVLKGIVFRYVSDCSEATVLILMGNTRGLLVRMTWKKHATICFRMFKSESGIKVNVTKYNGPILNSQKNLRLYALSIVQIVHILSILPLPVIFQNLKFNFAKITICKQFRSRDQNGRTHVNYGDDFQ